MSSSAAAPRGLAPALGTSPAISVSGLSKAYQIYERPEHRLWQSIFRGRRRFYREFVALSDVTFDISRGEVVGIVGRNGSGKSTLLQLICGTLTPTRGAASTAGRVAALLELGSGFNPEFTGRENVYLNGAILGLTRDEIDRRYAAIVAFADIGPFIDQPIKTYSTGMVVRLAFSVIAHVDADVLVIDEALAVGDAFFVQKCMRFLREFMTRGTILFVSHDTGAVVNLCRRAIWLHEGRVAMDGGAREVTERYLASLAADGYDGRSAPPQDTGASFGKGGARIADVALVDERGAAVRGLSGAERVTLRVRCEARERLDSPIVGFIVKDRLGQVIFAENTFARYAGRAVPVAAGERIEARFTFEMPRLAPGDYSIGVAVADGTQAAHVQHHWIHEALVVTSIARDVVAGLVGIPMIDVVVEAGTP
jgi:lipopolysaccharide transport system ATP-binding protein